MATGTKLGLRAGIMMAPLEELTLIQTDVSVKRKALPVFGY